MSGLFSHYGLTGQTVRIRRKSGESEAYPWGHAEQKMRITMETPYFLVAEVLPHRHPMGFGLSLPYLTTLHKHDIQTGDYIIKEVSKK